MISSLLITIIDATEREEIPVFCQGKREELPDLAGFRPQDTQ